MYPVGIIDGGDLQVGYSTIEEKDLKTIRSIAIGPTRLLNAPVKVYVYFDEGHSKLILIPPHAVCECNDTFTNLGIKVHHGYVAPYAFEKYRVYDCEKKKLHLYMKTQGIAY